MKGRLDSNKGPGGGASTHQPTVYKFVMSSVIRDEKTYDLEKQCEQNDCYILMLENAYKMSLREKNQIEMRFNKLQSKVAICLVMIETLKVQLRNIHSLSNHR